MTICGRCLIECSALRQKHNAGKDQYTKCALGAPSRLTLKKFNISTNLLLLIVQNAGVSYLLLGRLSNNWTTIIPNVPMYVTSTYCIHYIV